MIYPLNTRSAALASFGIALVSTSASANVLTNGGFETGDLTGWAIIEDTASVSNADPLAGSFSAIQTSGIGVLSQGFSAFTTTATASFIFQADTPSGNGNRSINFRMESSGDAAINLRVTESAGGALGDVEAFNGIVGSGGSWELILTDVVTYDTVQSFSVTTNSYGAGASYEVTVAGSSTGALSFYQVDNVSDTFSDFNEIAFNSNAIHANSTVKVDDVVVIPEPGTFSLLAGLAGLFSVFLRRRR